MGLLANILVAVGMLLVFLDMVLRRRVDQGAVWMLHVGVLLIGLGVLLGAAGFVGAS